MTIRHFAGGGSLAGAVLLTGGNNPQVTSAEQTNGFGRVDLDYTATGSTPDALAFFYGGANGVGGTRTGYFNERGELRARPSTANNVPFRAQAHASGSNVDILQVTSSDNNTVYLGVSQTAASFGVPVSIQGSVAAVDHGYSPADYGLLGWVGDPGYLAGALAVTAGIVHLLKIKLPKAVTISNIVHRQGGSPTLTSGQNFAALFDGSGNRVAVTEDQTTAWGTQGTKVSALTSTYAAPAGFVYVGLLFNGAGMPTLPRYGQSTQFSNVGLAAANLRFAQSGSSLTSMPSSITMSSNVDDATGAFWAGVS